jgi:hypothetical protein
MTCRSQANGEYEGELYEANRLSFGCFDTLRDLDRRLPFEDQ